MDRYEFTLDRYTRCMLFAITVLLTVVAVELWVARPTILPAADAQVPDSGKQRYQAIQEARKTNETLRQILDHLRSKAIKVRIETTDKRSKPPPLRNGP